MRIDKQIEEMAKIVCDELKMPKETAGLYEILGVLYNAGYRKASDVASEIFAELEDYMFDFEDITHTVNRTIGAATFALLKKKYTEDIKDVT